MSFLRRLTGRGDPPVPEWASFLSPSEFRAFLDAVEADLRRRSLPFTMGDGVVNVTLPTGPNQFGLFNLVQLCNVEGRPEWDRVIATHFTTMLQLQGRDYDAIAADWEQVARILKLRIYPEDFAPPGSAPVIRPVAPGIASVLVYDFPDSIGTTHRDHLAEWPVSEDELFETALRNTLTEAMPVQQHVPAEGGATVEAFLGDSFYVTTRVLDLPTLLPGLGAAGAVVALPHRHALLTHPIVDLRVVQAIQTLIQVAAGMYREGPGSITDQLYWWRDGRLTHLPVRVEGRSIQFHPPDAFVELLNGLASAPGSA
jgi:hypothetical protein